MYYYHIRQSGLCCAARQPMLNGPICHVWRSGGGGSVERVERKRWWWGRGRFGEGCGGSSC